MKKIFIILVFIASLISCESVERNIELTKENSDLQESVSNLNETKSALEKDVQELKKEISILSSEQSPKYFISIKIHQKTFTLSIGEHIKNKMNDVVIWVETSESFYKSVRIGQVISADVKSGSFWIDGDISKLEIKIEDKKIK